MRIEVVSNQWESDFFARPIGKVNFVEHLTVLDKTEFALVQAKIGSAELDKITLLQQQGFVLVEGEVDFCLALANLSPEPTACEVASEADIGELQTLFGNAFPTSRFRSPYFSTEENCRFYQTWIAKAVRGEFDHLCLIARSTSGQIKGGISLRANGNQVRVGLLAVSPLFQGQGIARQLLTAAICWAKLQQASQLWIATQISNLPAINLYQKLGAKIHNTAYWFYLLTS